MKKLIVILVMILALFMPVTTNAGGCEYYFEELVGRSFEVTVGDVDYNLYFKESAYGPCPSGIAVLSYIDIQIINGIKYMACIEFDCSYTTTTDIVTIEGWDFILFDEQLILLPEEPLILRVMED